MSVFSQLGFRFGDLQRWFTTREEGVAPVKPEAPFTNSHAESRFAYIVYFATLLGLASSSLLFYAATHRHGSFEVFRL
jgi:hypothetical protein